MEWLRFHFLVCVILYILQDVKLPRPIRLFDNRPQIVVDDERSVGMMFLFQILIYREVDYYAVSLTKVVESTDFLFNYKLSFFK